MIMFAWARVIETSVLSLSLRSSAAEIVHSANTSLAAEHQTTSLLANALQVLAQGGFVATVRTVIQFAVAILEENSLHFALNCIDTPRFSPDVRAIAQEVRNALAHMSSE